MIAPHILIADDEDLFLNLIREMVVLSFEGARVETVSSAYDALGHILANDFDVILSDIQLGDVTGIDLVRQTRNLRPAPTIVLMTGDHTLLPQAFDSGAYACLRKPFDRDLMAAVLKRAIDFNNLQRRAERIRQSLAFQVRPTYEHSMQAQLRTGEIEKQMAEMRKKELDELVPV